MTHTPKQNDSSQFNQVIKADIIGVDSLDFGYPNIVHVATSFGCYEGSMIGFNHTSVTTYAGISAIRHDNNDGYSEIIRLKEGQNYVRRLGGSYERWGDYFGMQTDYNNPQHVYTAGFYGTYNNSSSTWFSRMHFPSVGAVQTEIIKTDPTIYYGPVTLFTIVDGGYPPYTYLWSDSTTDSKNSFNMIYDDPGFTSYSNGPEFVKVTDSKGCVLKTNTNNYSTQFVNDKLFPNPVTDVFSVTFFNPFETTGSFEIFDMGGKLITSLGNQKIHLGNNVFSFSASPLQKGSFILIIRDKDGNEISKKSFIKL
jgi:hypothetical protein